MRNLFGRAVSVDVTPQTGAVLGASGDPNTVVESVADRLEANVLVLEDGESTRVCLISIDTLYIGHALRQALVRQLHGLLGEHEIILLASHTHHAPMLDSTKPKLGRVTQDYLSLVVSTIGDAVANLMAGEAVPVTVLTGSEPHGLATNRRRRRLLSLSRRGLALGDIQMAPNPHGLTDNLVRRLRFVSVSGAPLADLWSVAIHPTGFPLIDMVSADYPGRVRERVRSVEGRDFPVLFAQGFSGDVRPDSGLEERSVRSVLRGRRFKPFDLDAYQRWANELADAVLSTRLMADTDSSLALAQVEVTRDELYLMSEGPERGFIRALRIGSTAVVCVPGEVVAEYALELAGEGSSVRMIFGVGCTDHVWGYIPTGAMLEEGGYEVSGFCSAFEVQSVAPGIDAVVRSRLSSALGALGSGD